MSKSLSDMILQTVNEIGRFLPALVQDHNVLDLFPGDGMEFADYVHFSSIALPA